MIEGVVLSARYRLERKVGRGGIGTVYQATDLRTGAGVAVKVLHDHLAEETGFVGRFHRGARIARKLQHPHIVQVLDHGSDGDRHFLVMEFVQGKPLSQLLQERGKLPEKEALSIARQVALALDAAHHQSVVHRDISPGNILITKDGSVKVSDFDVARASDATRMTQTGLFVGKVRYGAPEAFLGRTDIRSDIYSLGIVLYEMLMGRVPFDSDTPFAVVEMHRSTEPPGLEQLDKLGEGTLAVVVQRCLEKRPEERFQSPQGVLSALEGRDVEARVSTPAKEGGMRSAGSARVRPQRLPGGARWSAPDWLRRPIARYLLLGIGSTLAVAMAVAVGAVVFAGGGSSGEEGLGETPEEPVAATATATAATPPPVAAASADDDPFIGPADAPVTIIEFSDYQCPFCKRFRDETLDQILETYEGKVRFVYRDFPLSSVHPYAQKAAEASECADDQGKSWEYHDILFANQSVLDVASLKTYADQLGLDTATFNECLDEGKKSSEVGKDSEDARASGVTGTPAFFINGQLVSGAIPFEDYTDSNGATQPGFKSIIDAALGGEVVPTVTSLPVVAASGDDDPFIGPADAPVTIIEFSDYQCPFCKRFRDETLDQILETYEGKVRFVYRDFPLSSVHPYAQKAAEASECADDQGKSWEYHDILFANQSVLDVASLKTYADQLGLDTATFNECLDEGKKSSEVGKDSEDARASGVTGTPAFFINGQLVSGAIPFEDYTDSNGATQPGFKSIIDAALRMGQ